MDLGSANFGAFFHAIHGHDPFPWQQALVDILAENDKWPEVIDLPTGSGKTAALDAAVFHLALRWREPQRSALRIALVVDRRLVVDDAYARAERISYALAHPSRAGGGAVVAEIARRLRHLAGEGEPPLVAQRLRGGAPLEHDWARTPTQPLILCSTVDQVGSRLLFRGYGVSNRMKPIHAGLLGANSLIMLDEAHLSEPFRQTLGAVQVVGKAGVKFVLLSATSGVRPERPFKLTAEDHGHPTLKRRLEASKPAELHTVTNREKAAADFVKLACTMRGHLQQGGVSSPAVGVVVNRVDLARAIFEELNKEPVGDALLMIGRSRAVDRDRIVEKLQPFRTGACNRSETSPLFVVATQCLEVGVDLDLDGLVTQAASFDALRQRFGRLNRDGRSIPAEGAILALLEDTAKHADDPVYGDRIKKTWEKLKLIAQDNKVDFGIAALDLRLQESSIDTTEIATVRAQAPVLMPAYLDLWAQTSPPPAADPEVGLFLHGVEGAFADVSLVWRSDIAESDLEGDNTADLNMLMKLVPPRAAEMINIPLWSAKQWLRTRSSTAKSGRVADVPGRAEEETSDTEGSVHERRAFRWAGGDDPRTGIVRPADLRPGDVLVVPSNYGGCDDFGWVPERDTPVADVADTAAYPFRGRRHAVRVSRDAAPNQWPRLSEILATDGVAGRDLVERLLNVLPPRAGLTLDDDYTDAVLLRSLREPLEALRRANGSGIRRISINFPYVGRAQGGAVLVASHGLWVESAPDTANGGGPSTEDDTLSRTSLNPVSINQHADHVVKFTDRFVQTLHLPPTVADDLRLAAFLHDAGKADRRFQILLSGADPWNCPDGSALAKSGQVVHLSPRGVHRQSPKGGWERAGLPKNWRHEALSVRMAQAHSRFAEAHDPAFVLWLIGTHHGYGRPFFGFVEDRPETDRAACLEVETWQVTPEPGPQSAGFDFNGADWPGLYEELKQRYGIWELARLEAILRLADHRASEAEGTL